jgi:AraC-like DNA-binding protein
MIIEKVGIGLYKVFIVDDDFQFIEQIQGMIPWELLGYCIVDIEIFGVAGLGKFFSYEPDILILANDVYIMRGEEFLLSIQKASHNYRILYLGSPDSVRPDFPQVSAYINKSTLTGDRLVQLLQTAVSELEAERNAVHDIIARNVDESPKTQEILQFLLDGMSTYKFEYYRRQFGLRLYDTDLVLLAFKCTQNADVHKRCCREIAKLLDDYANGEQLTISKQVHYILFNLPQASIIIQNKAHEYLLTQILEVLATDIQTPIRLYVGNTIHITALRAERDALLELMEYDYFTAYSQLIRRKKPNTIKLEKLIPQIDLFCLDIQQCVRRHDRIGLGSALKELFSDIQRSINFAVRDLARRRLNQTYMLLCTGNLSVAKPDNFPDSFDYLELEYDWYHTRFLQLLEIVEYRTGMMHKFVQYAVEYIEVHYMDNISLATAAQEISVSKSYLCTLFKEGAGMGFSDYLNQYRISKAKEILVEGRPVAEASVASGYLDAKYFSRVFKHYTGISPKCFQLQNTQERK